MCTRGILLLPGQKANNFDWYRLWNAVCGLDPLDVPGRIYSTFVDQWKADVSARSKLQFYNSVKGEFGEEMYLNLSKKKARDAIARLRSSSHDLNIERGRYKPGKSLMNRLCRFCCLNDVDSKEVLEQAEFLPFFDPIIETEHHALTECPAYHHIRMRLSDSTKSLLVRGDYGILMQQQELLNEFGNFLRRSYDYRNPKPKTEKSKLTVTKLA